MKRSLTYRYYEPNLQRWLNRDPIDIRGGFNLHRFNRNSPLNRVDFLGLMPGAEAAIAEQGVSLAEMDAMVAEGNALLEAGGGAAAVAEDIMATSELAPQLAAAEAVGAGGLWLGDYIGEKSGLHDAIADLLVPDPDSAALPLHVRHKKTKPAPPNRPPCPPRGPSVSSPAPDPGDQDAARRKAVRDAWKQERDLVKRTDQGTRRWTDAEKQELLETGQVEGYEGHHINSVNSNPDLAADPDNIQFVTRAEHFYLHNGNWSNPTWGARISR